MDDRDRGAVRRFLTLADVAEIMACELDEVRALIASGELAALRIGEHGAWRVEQGALERFIDDQYELQRRAAAFREAEFQELPEISGGRIIARGDGR